MMNISNDLIKYRKADINDIEILVESRIIFLKEIQSPKNKHDEDRLKKGLRKYFAETIPTNEYTSWLAEYHGELIGFGALVSRRLPGHFEIISGRQGYIANMYTKPEARGMGVCNTILNKLIEQAKSMNIELLSLHSSPDGITIYKKRGFLPPGHPYLGNVTK